MAYNQAHNLLTFGGTITAGVDAEVWQCGIRFGDGNYLMGQGSPIGPSPSTTAILNALKADLTTWWDANSGIFSNAARMTWLKFNAIGTDGRYIDQQETYGTEWAPVKQGNASGSLPPQVAVAVTFRTNASRGLASRGRIYLPPLGPSASVGAGRLAHERRDQFATTTATLLTNLANWPAFDAPIDPGKPCVMSNVGAGATRRINRVDCGDLFDTLRSRRNRLNEVRSAEAVVTS